MSDETVADAKARLKSVLREGKSMDCPLCGQNCAVYKRSINKTQAATLFWMFSRPEQSLKIEERWIDIPSVAPKWVLRSKQHTTLKHWGLIEQLRTITGDRKFSGHWRLTELGVKFIMRQASIPRYVYIYDDTVVKVSKETVSVDDTLGNVFDYSSLIQGDFGDIDESVP